MSWPKRVVVLDDDKGEAKLYTLKVVLPNSTSVTLTVTNPEPEMSVKNFVNLVKAECDKTRDVSAKKRKQVDWNLAAESYLEFNGEKIKGMVQFDKFKPDSCNIIRLDDGSGEPSIMYENMWNKREKDTTQRIECRAFNFNGIQLTPALTFEKYEIGCSTPQSEMSSTHQTPWMVPTHQTPLSQLGVLRIRASSSARGFQNDLMDMVQYTEVLKEKLERYGGCKVEVDERLKCLEAEQKQAEQEISTLQASLGPLGGVFPGLLSTKELMVKHIEEKQRDTAASTFCCLYRKTPPPQSLILSMKGVFGIVAHLGSVASTSLSRVLSEYLIHDTMLALVCKSSQFGPKSAEYLRLKFEVARRGRSITNRFHILCLEKTRPWKDGLVENNDPQRKLAMDDPKLPLILI